MGNGSGRNADQTIPLLDGDIRGKRSSLSLATRGFMASLHGSVCLCQWVCEKATHCVCVCVGWVREIDNMMFTLGLLSRDCASIQPCCDTHHTSNLVPFIISLYSQRPHLVCYYQRSLLFPSMYVWNPTETNMSNTDNSAILVNPIVYIILKTCNPEIIHISDF